jgi:hypothetical protein
MARSIRKITAKRKEEIRKHRVILNREKDTRFWIHFLPLPGVVIKPEEEPKWRIEVAGNPKWNPELLRTAQRIFINNLGIDSWESVAAGTKTESQWCG